MSSENALNTANSRVAARSAHRDTEDLQGVVNNATNLCAKVWACARILGMTLTRKKRKTALVTLSLRSDFPPR